MPKTLAERFRVEPGTRVDLAKHDPEDASAFPDRDEAEVQSEADARIINEWQDKLYAEGRRALLVVLLVTDAAGKDGTIRHVFNDTGPLGVTAGLPAAEEESGARLPWRASRLPVALHRHLQPLALRDVLVGRVRKLAPAEEIERRYDQINAFERILSENGTTILKFMLHISRKEQGERLKDRLDEPRSRWKFDPRDLDDRKLWDAYQGAYQIMLTRCSTPWAPWHVIPADRKWARNAAIAAIVRETWRRCGRYPKPAWDPKVSR
jgi:PPK2 family polyphosphate:nucleotide phosphotransferase